MGNVSSRKIALDALQKLIETTAGDKLPELGQRLTAWKPKLVKEVRRSRRVPGADALNRRQAAEICYLALRAGESLSELTKVLTEKVMTINKAFWWLVKKLTLGVLKWLIGPFLDEVMAAVMDGLKRIWQWIKDFFGAVSDVRASIAA